MARIEYYQVGDVSDFDKGWREELAEAVNGHDDSIIALVAADVALDARLDTAEADIDALELAAAALDTRLDTAETDIDALQAVDIALDGRLDTAETDIDALQAADIALDARLDTAEATLISHGTRLATDEADIATLQTSNATKLNQAQVLRMISLRF